VQEISKFAYCIRETWVMSGNVDQSVVQWYHALDFLVGQNMKMQNVERGMKLAASCEHPDAKWLTKTFDGNLMCKDVLLGNKDPRALFFAAVMFGAPLDIGRLQQSAELGYALAQTKLSGFANSLEEQIALREKAAAQGEREAHALLGDVHNRRNLREKAMQCFLFAARLGHLFSMLGIIQNLGMSDPQRFFWLGEAAAGGMHAGFFADALPQVGKHCVGTGSARIMYAIGRALNGQINQKERTIFGSSLFYGERIEKSLVALEFYQFQVKSYRTAVDTWMLVGRRNNVVKDVRLIISKLIWETRADAKYK
jgi:hypothetical protein